MAKKIDRTRIEAGRFELPKKLAFLMEERVEFVSVTDKDGDWTVELPVAAVKKLLKARTDLKAVKAEHKLAGGQSAAALAAADAGHNETREALAKAERRIRALEKKLQTAAPAPAAQPSPAAAPTSSTPKPLKAATKKVEAPRSAAGHQEAAVGSPQVKLKAPPKKLSAKKPTVVAQPASAALESAVDTVQAATNSEQAPVIATRPSEAE